MINKVILIGNLGADPEIRVLESGTKVAKLSLATNESYKDKKGEWQTMTEWHNISAWRGLAERAERDLKKGSLVFVEGKLTYRKYQDKDGVERYLTDVYAFTIRLLEKREAGTDSGGQTSEFQKADEKQKSESGEASEGHDSADNMEEDDLPF